MSTTPKPATAGNCSDDDDTLKIIQEIDEYLEESFLDNTTNLKKSDKIEKGHLKNHDTAALDEVTPNENVYKQFAKTKDAINVNNPIDNFSFASDKIDSIQKDIIQKENVSKQFTKNSTEMDILTDSTDMDILPDYSTVMNKIIMDNFSFASKKIGNIQKDSIQKENVSKKCTKNSTKMDILTDSTDIDILTDCTDMDKTIMDNFSFASKKIDNIQDNSSKSKNIIWKPCEKFDYSDRESKNPNTEYYEQIANQTDLDTSSNRNNEFQRPFESNPQKKCPSSLFLPFTQPSGSKFQSSMPHFEDFKQQPTKIQGKYQFGHNMQFGYNNNELKKLNIGNKKSVFNNLQVPYQKIQNRQQFNLPQHENKQNFNLLHHENKLNLNLPRHEHRQNSLQDCIPSLQGPQTSHTQTNNNELHRVIKDHLRPDSMSGLTIRFSPRKLINSKTKEELIIALKTYGTLEFLWTPDNYLFARYISRNDTKHVYQMYMK